MYIYICTSYIHQLYTNEIDPIMIKYISFTFYSFFIRSKERGVVNGITGRVKHCEGETIYIENSSSDIISVFPVYSEEQQCFPILACKHYP